MCADLSPAAHEPCMCLSCRTLHANHVALQESFTLNDKRTRQRLGFDKESSTTIRVGKYKIKFGKGAPCSCCCGALPPLANLRSADRPTHAAVQMRRAMAQRGSMKVCTA